MAEVTIIKFAWTFALDYAHTELVVIWVLGVSMIFLAGFIHFPKKLVIVFAILVVFGHNMLDDLNPTGPFTSGLWVVLHQFKDISIGAFDMFIGYPLIPWIFVMPLGYYFGTLYLPSVDGSLRVKRILQLGFTLTMLFFVLRAINFYGDLYAWSAQASGAFSIMSFFNVTKYPPSLMYLLITLGPALIFLSLAEKWHGSITKPLVVIGRVPMFYYIIHIYIIHSGALIAAYLTGFNLSDMVIDTWITEQPELVGYGFSLGVVYLLWVILMLAMYPICKRYNDYKQNNRDKWWLSYL